MATKKAMAGVYFLINKGEVVYIGSSNNIFHRVADHIKEDKKEFDSFDFYETNDHVSLEGFLIKLLKPKYNVSEGGTKRENWQDFFNMKVLDAIKAFENQHEWIDLRYFSAIIDEHIAAIRGVIEKNNIPMIIGDRGLRCIHRSNIEKADEWKKMIRDYYRDNDLKRLETRK